MLGMHRSGTSAITGTLRLCGAWVGEEAELTGAGEENPRGFWERRDTRNICDRLLHSAGADWWNIAQFEPENIPRDILAEERTKLASVVSSLRAHGTWVLKEPRLCLLLPALHDCLANVVCVHVFRNPLEVARSLQTRNGFGIGAGLALWEAYNRSALNASSDLPRVLVSYEALALRPAETVERLLERLGEYAARDLVRPDEDCLRQFVDPSLYRRRAGADETLECLSPSQRSLWQDYCAGRVFQPNGSTGIPRATEQHLLDLRTSQTALNRHEERARESTSSKGAVANVQHRAATLNFELKRQRAITQAQERTIRGLETTITNHESFIRARDATIQDLDAIVQQRGAIVEERDTAISKLLSSTSWRVTVPLRALSRTFKWVSRSLRRAINLLCRPCASRLADAARFLPGRVQRPVSEDRDHTPPTAPVKDAEPTDRAAAATPATIPARAVAPSLAKSPVVLSPAIARQRIDEAEEAFNLGDYSPALSLGPDVQREIACFDTLLGRAKLLPSLARRLSNLDAYKEQVKEYTAARDARPGNRMALYTAIAGNYDCINVPETLNPKFDYIAFTDSPAADTGVWSIRPIPYFHSDAARAARFVKTHPHILLGDYDIAVWVDSNVTLLNDIEHFVEGLLSSGQTVGAIPHPLRNSIYEEFIACSKVKKDNIKVMQEQIDKYKNESFDHSDLIESGFMVFYLRHRKIKLFLECWWSEIDRHSKCDQLSLNYSLRKARLPWHPLTAPPINIRTHEDFALVPHDQGAGPSKRLVQALKLGTIDPYAGPAYSQVKAERVHAQKERTVDIVVCVHNALEDVRACLDSVLTTRNREKHRLILLDDGSDVATAEFLASVSDETPNCDLYRYEVAQGYTRAANRGLAESTGELVVLLNSDTIVTDRWVEKLCDAVFTTPGAGIVGPLSNAASRQSIPEYKSTENQTAINPLPPGHTPDDMNAHCEAWTVEHILPLSPLVHGFCFGIRRDVLDGIGLLDEVNFPKGYGEEDDYCFRATDAGFLLVLATHTYIYHAKSRSYTDDIRIPIAKASSRRLQKLHGTPRIGRALRSLEHNPVLQRFRANARELYE
ncbi:MAG: glycosyltransferase [Rhodospirillales bacterium]|nr:glycosyltransferase [Rhodospirillales bacterium]